ncbi:methionine--tRNA ligase [bacterium]|nr:methionine--tRNA ligase [bacterium]
MKKKKEKIFIGVAWPYVNGEMHIGHLAGYLLPADILARFFRLKGHKVLMVSGSDCFGTPVLFEAMRKKTNPAQLAGFYHRKLKDLFKFLGISFDIYTKTNNPLHKKIVQDFFLRIYKKGFIKRKKVRQYYSPKDKIFLPDRFVEGICKYCGYSQARSDQCDNCGRILEPGELENPRNRLTNSEVVLKETEHYFLDWPRLGSFFKKYVKSKSKYWRKWVKAETQGWLKKGLLERAITRDIRWGVKIPIDKLSKKERIENYHKKSIYVWFDAVIGYFSASVQYFKQKSGWRDFWQKNDVRHYYFMGKDNLLFHTLFWPGQLHLYDPKLHLPDVVCVNQYLNFEGKKFSKSRGVIINCDYLARKYGLDETRFYLCWIMPETKDSSFSWEDFAEQVNGILVGKIGNLAHRTIVLAKKKDYKVPLKPEIDKKIIQKVKKTFQLVEKNISECKFRDYLKKVVDLAEYANKYFDKKKLWAVENKDEFNKITSELLYIIGAIRIFLLPLLPNASERLRKTLGVEKVVEIDSFVDLHNYLLESFKEIKIKKPSPLFKKITKEQIKAEKNGKAI